MFLVRLLNMKIMFNKCSSIPFSLQGCTYTCHSTPRPCIHIHDFHVTRSPFDHGTCDYEYELFFKRKTILKVCLSSSIPFFGFVDTEFSVLRPLLGDNTYIIGMIHIFKSMLLHTNHMIVLLAYKSQWNGRYCGLYSLCWHLCLRQQNFQIRWSSTYQTRWP